MRQDDHKALGAIQREAYPAHLRESFATLVRKASVAPEFCFVCEEALSGTVCAYLIAYPASPAHLSMLDVAAKCGEGGESWYIHDMSVSPRFQGNALGKRLFLHALREVWERGFRQSHLIAIARAVPFWKKFGYIAEEVPPEAAATLAGYGAEARLMRNSALPRDEADGMIG